MNLVTILYNLKILFKYSKFKRTSDDKRMTAEVLLESYLPDDLKVYIGTPISGTPISLIQTMLTTIPNFKENKKEKDAPNRSKYYNILQSIIEKAEKEDKILAVERLNELI